MTTTSTTPSRTPRTNLLLLLILAAAAWLRLTSFDLMEFKYDEVTAIVQAKEWLSRGVPRHGMQSGVGVVNPPGFMFFLCPLAALASSPLATGMAVALLNIAAVALAFRLGAKLGRPSAGLWAAAFMAVHPWLILYSRKIWAQSLLPFFVLLFLNLIVHLARRPRSRSVFWLGPLVCLTWQIHYSAWCLAIFAAVWVAFEAVRKRLNGFMALTGMLGGLFLLVPYLSYLFGTGFGEAMRSLDVGGESPGFGHSLAVFGMWRRTAFAGGFAWPFLWQAGSLADVFARPAGPWLQACAQVGTGLILALAACSALAFLGGKESAPDTRVGVAWLAFFALLSPVVYAARGIATPPHYFIIGLPALLMLAGIGIHEIVRRHDRGFYGLPVVKGWPGVLVLICGVVVWMSVIRRIERDGGTGGDYGLTYRVQADAARRLAAAGVAPDRLDASLTRDYGIGIRYLMKFQLPDAARVGNRQVRLIDSLIYPDERCGDGQSEERVGPLRMCESVGRVSDPPHLSCGR